MKYHIQRSIINKKRNIECTKAKRNYIWEQINIFIIKELVEIEIVIFIIQYSVEQGLFLTILFIFDNIPIGNIAGLMYVSSKIAVRFCKYMWKICSISVIANKTNISCSDIEVEIDESKFSKRKYIRLYI